MFHTQQKSPFEPLTSESHPENALLPHHLLVFVLKIEIALLVSSLALKPEKAVYIYRSHTVAIHHAY